MESKNAKNRAIIFLVVAVIVYFVARSIHTISPIGKPIAYVIGVVGLVLGEQAFGKHTASLLRILTLVAVWVLGLNILEKGTLPTSAFYLLFVFCIAATVAFFDGAMKSRVRKLAYGAVAIALIWPILLALAYFQGFADLFGAGATKPMGIAAIFAAGLYAGGLLLAPILPPRQADWDDYQEEYIDEDDEDDLDETEKPKATDDYEEF